MGDEPRKVALDGGPLSTYKSGNVVRFPTVKVKHKKTGATMVIRESDFDSKVHAKVGAQRVSLSEKDDDPKKGFGSEPRDELLKMTIDQLKAKPEWAAADQSAKTKEQIVDAILPVREE
jgi:hypothetical protein